MKRADAIYGCTKCGKPVALVGDPLPADWLCQWCSGVVRPARTGGIGATVTTRSTPYEVQSTGGAVMTRTLGTCSLCGGAVTVPTAWLGVRQPTPTCSSCGATAAAHGPVIPMRREPSETERRHRACLPTPEEIRARNPHADLRWARYFGSVNEETSS